MSVLRKENDSLVKKAGRALVDLALSLTSNHAVANSAVSTAIAARNVTLYNGKLYEINLDGTRGAEIQIGGGSMPTLNFRNPLHTFSSGNLTFRATKECYISGATGTVGAFASNCTISINGTIIATPNTVIYGSGSGGAVGISYVPPIKITSGDIVTVGTASPNLHVFEEK